MGWCKRCDFKEDIFVFKHVEDSYQCPKCGSYKVKILFYPDREADYAEFDEDDSY
jgi:Zn finger protein HypA/HybF involved in hydrogenase expression